MSFSPSIPSHTPKPHGSYLRVPAYSPMCSKRHTEQTVQAVFSAAIPAAHEQGTLRCVAYSQESFNISIALNQSSAEALLKEKGYN